MSKNLRLHWGQGWLQVHVILTLIDLKCHPWPGAVWPALMSCNENSLSPILTSKMGCECFFPLPDSYMTCTYRDGVGSSRAKIEIVWNCMIFVFHRQSNMRRSRLVEKYVHVVVTRRRKKKQKKREEKNHSPKTDACNWQTRKFPGHCVTRQLCGAGAKSGKLRYGKMHADEPRSICVSQNAPNTRILDRFENRSIKKSTPLPAQTIRPNQNQDFK